MSPSFVARSGRDDSGIPYRVVCGWRHAEVARTLDAAVAFEGSSWWIEMDEVEELESSQFWRAKQQRRSPVGVEAQRKNNRLQAAKWRDRARDEWRAYALAYLAKHDASTKPIGFDRWSRDYRQLWLSDPAACVDFVNQPTRELFNPSLRRDPGIKPQWLAVSA